jgi:hypothetical protein
MNDTSASSRFELCDYSGLLSHDALNHPSARARKGKFMLVERSGTIYLIMGAIGVYEYHADLLAKFCTDHQLAYHWVGRPANLAIGDTSVKLHGGGWVQVDPEAKQVTFSGRSTAYGGYERGVLVAALAKIELAVGVKMGMG